MSDDKINMNHGAGGEVMANLISRTVLDNITKKSVNGGISLDDLDDGASIPLGDYEIVVTTDGHTIDPLFFPGGDFCNGSKTTCNFKCNHYAGRFPD